MDAPACNYSPMLFPAYEYNAQLLYSTTPLTAFNDARLTAPQRLACLSCAAASKRSTCLALNAAGDRQGGAVVGQGWKVRRRAERGLGDGPPPLRRAS